MDLYRLNLNLLIALDVLLSERSVTQAANKLFITQAGMSNNLQQCRILFKDDLLVREKNHMVLTTFAQELQPRLHQVLKEVESLVVSGQRFDPLTSTRLFTIGMSDYMGSLLLPKLIPRLQKKAPAIKLNVTTVHHLGSTLPFEKGEYDLGVGKVFTVDKPVQTHFLFKDFAVCLLNKKHPYAKKKKISLTDYLNADHIAARIDDPNYPPIIELALAKLGLERNIVVSLPFINPFFNLIEQTTTLLATVISCMADQYRNKFEYVTKLLPFTIPDIEFHLAWHQRYENDLGHQWLREEIIDCYKGY